MAKADADANYLKKMLDEFVDEVSAYAENHGDDELGSFAVLTKTNEGKTNRRHENHKQKKGEQQRTQSMQHTPWKLKQTSLGRSFVVVVV